jgi:nitrite reductase/ring-hydroxylating ferredoxin subunit
MVTETKLQSADAVMLCRSDDLWDGEMACFPVAGIPILLVRLSGQFHAYDARCPHQGFALVEGNLDGERLTCRAHQWQFDLATGQGVNPKRACLRRFPTHVVAGHVLVEPPSTAGNAALQSHGDHVMANAPDRGAAADNLVGPIIRAGDFAAVVAQAIEDDNPGQDVQVIDRGDYVRIHTVQQCRLTRRTLERHLGHPYALRLLEIEMPSFAGRLRTREDEFVWFYDR